MFDPDFDENDVGNEIRRAEAMEVFEAEMLRLPEDERVTFEEWCETAEWGDDD